MKSGQVTIKDIAKELNISVSTVSRALAGNPLVKPSTKAAVIELAEKLNYQPNYTALSLRNNTTKTLGVIIPQLVHDFFSMVVRGIEDVAYASGYSVIICNSHESYEREVIDTKTLMNGRVDGVLACITKHTKDVTHFKEFVNRSIPLVFFDCVVDDIDTDKVIIDDYEASYNAVNHLIETGRKHIAYIGGPISLLINQNRYKGYKDALEKHGMSVNDNIVAHCETGDFADGTSSAKKFMDNNQQFDAIFGATDMLAIGAIKHLKKAGKVVPHDISVFGFSNWKISELYEPSLSTVDQPGYEMGRISAELLLNQIRNEDDTFSPKTEILKTDLIVRESSTI
ncbi:MAG: LacI family transcriptional regulator [bacterium]|nr:LacI family transcriptional regulator [bacterium]